MDESESKNEKQQNERRFDPELLKKGLRCDQDQYEMLKRCSDKKDMTEWNEWRNKNWEEEIWLEGADLWDAYLEGVDFMRAHLERAELYSAHIERACLSESHLEGAILALAYLEGTDLQTSIVDGETSIWHPRVNRYSEHSNYTNFEGVALHSARIDSATKQLLEYNIRRMNWEDWYNEHPRLKWLVKPFWWISDYGLSTKRIIVTFLGLAFIFANIYYHWGRIAPPGIVKYLFVDRSGIEVQCWLVPLRTLYFSIVTMTTLGFGDMYANARSIWGHLLLMLQVILGYVLLGALVTRFAVLFTAGGPAGKFSD